MTIFSYILFIKTSFISLREQGERERKKKKQTVGTKLPSAGSLLKCLQWLGLGQTKVVPGIPVQVSHMSNKDPPTCTIICCFPGEGQRSKYVNYYNCLKGSGLVGS